MTDGPSELRERIVRAAAKLLTEGGREAVSTRGVSAAAGVQAPAIYRQFGDMHGLLQAAARAVLARYVQQKERGTPAADPVAELRHGWDLHVAFGLANPAAYALLYADPDAASGDEARQGLLHLTALLTRVAQAGRLQVSIPLAVDMVHAAGNGVTISLISAPPDARDPKLSTAVREAVLGAILSPEKEHGPGRGRRLATRAVALRAELKDSDHVLTKGETILMEELLDRLSEGEHSREAPRKHSTRRSPRR